MTIPKYPEGYEPTDWVQMQVGQHFKSFNRKYLCFGYDPRQGFWMRSVDDPEDERNVSERAIDRTFHRCRGL